MASPNDYFANHRRVRRFPWSLYHGPLEADLGRFLRDLPQSRETNVLVIGCGLMQELDQAPGHLRFTVVDIDQRAVDAVASDPRVVTARRVESDEDLSSLGPFDALYAKEVIEHIVPVPPYLAQLRRTLRPGGHVWLSTPNYGEPWLPAIEATFLEVVARRSGYTRRGLHPSKFSRSGLQRALVNAGFTQVQVRTTSLRLALIGRARAPER
jgi:2-polyprenyl-3-methyl-5-hydroxy-6-metoxy-1,4-benzoquinol methylase